MLTLGQVYHQKCSKLFLVVNPALLWWKTHCLSHGYCNLPLASFAFDEFRKLCIEGRLTDAIQILYLRPHYSSSVSFSASFNCLLQGCIRYKDMETFNEAYSLIVKHGFETDSYLATSFIRMFAMHGSLSQADLVFAKLLEPDVVTWSAFISAHSKYGKFERVIDLYYRMKLSKIKPDGHVFVALLKACADSATRVALLHGKLIHFHAIERGLGRALFVNNALINMYSRCSDLEDATLVFESLPKKDLVTWSTMIGACVLYGCGSQAFNLFQRMQREGHFPDQITCVNALKACCGISALEDGKVIHSLAVENGFEKNVIMGSTLMDMYAKCADLEDAKTVFQALSKRDMIAWGAMIAGYTFNGKHWQAIQQYKEMVQEGLKPNGIILLSVLSSYNQLGIMDQIDSFLRLVEENFGPHPTKEHINCIINLLGRSGYIKEAEHMLQHGSNRSNVVGWTSLLNSCKIFGESEVGSNCFDEIVEIDCRDASSYMLMSEIYASVGKLKEAEGIKMMRENAQAWKKPGKAFIHVNGAVHEFTAGNIVHINIHKVMTKLQFLSAQIRHKGHVPLQDMDFK